MSDLAARARAVVASAAVTVRREKARGAEGEADPLEPADLAALYGETDGLELSDGTRILRRGEIAEATRWLCEERALEWDAALWVIGERDDLVIVRDLDPTGARAGGGVLETATDGLSSLRRMARGVIGYLEARVGMGEGGDLAPERAAREAMGRRDGEGLAAAIARGFYPGAEREMAQAAQALGGLRAGAGDARGAMKAFERAARARVSAVPRGAEKSESAAAWRAFAIVAGKAGAGEVAELCRRRAAE